jgi:hypothetical protein
VLHCVFYYAAGILVLFARECGPAWRAGIRGTTRDEYGRLVLGDIITAIIFTGVCLCVLRCAALQASWCSTWAKAAPHGALPCIEFTQNRLFEHTISMCAASFRLAGILVLNAREG